MGFVMLTSLQSAGKHLSTNKARVGYEADRSNWRVVEKITLNDGECAGTEVVKVTTGIVSGVLSPKIPSMAL